MKKTLALTLAVILCTSLFAVNVCAAAKPELKVLKGTPSIDGEIDEIWKNAEKMELDRFSEKKGSPAAKAYAKMLWDEESIYILTVVEDNTKSEQTDDVFSEEDCLELFFDFDNLKTEKYEKDNQFRLLYDGNLRTRDTEKLSEDWKSNLFLKVKETDSGYVYEAKINEKIGRSLDFAEGKKIGIDIGYDDSIGGERAGQLTWNSDLDSAGVPWGNPRVFGTAVLSNKSAESEKDASGSSEIADDNSAPAKGEKDSNKTVKIVVPVILGFAFGAVVVILINRNKKKK